MLSTEIQGFSDASEVANAADLWSTCTSQSPPIIYIYPGHLSLVMSKSNWGCTNQAADYTSPGALWGTTLSSTYPTCPTSFWHPSLSCTCMDSLIEQLCWAGWIYPLQLILSLVTGGDMSAQPTQQPGWLCLQRSLTLRANQSLFLVEQSRFVQLSTL